MVAVPDFSQTLSQYAGQYGVPSSYANTIMQIESGGRPGLTSPAGAIGLMQIMPGTAQGYGVSAQQLADPNVNLQTGAHLLGDLWHRYGGDPALTAVAYNAGPGWADRLRSGQITVAGLPAETQAYLQKLHGALSGQPAMQPQQPIQTPPSNPLFGMGGVPSPAMVAPTFTQEPQQAYNAPQTGLISGAQNVRNNGGGLAPDAYGYADPAAAWSGGFHAPHYASVLGNPNDALSAVGLALRGRSALI